MRPSHRTLRLAVVLALLPASATVTAAQSNGVISFTRAQSQRGAAVYAEQCADCHGNSLSGGQAMALTGTEFRARWSAPSRSIYELLDLVRTTMPVGKEGGLSNDDYLAVVAFVLERNDVAAGATPLAADRASLAAVRLASPSNATSAPESKGGGSAPAAVPPDATPMPPFGVVTAGPRGVTPTATGPTQADLRAAATNGRDWLLHTRDFGGSRYSPLTQVTSANASRLRVACAFQVGAPGAFQTGPVVYDGTMFFTSGHRTVAIDAASCRPKWRHDWQSPVPPMVANRGVAIKDGRVMRGTGDGHLIALDAADGTLLWSTRIGDISKGEMFSMPPLVYDSLVYIGVAVGELGARGWIAAHRISDGARVWRFNIVPAPGEPGSETWRKDAPFPLGGGAVWTPLSLDASRELLYLAAANPAPDFPVDERGGTNLYTNSVIALEARTGKLAWYQQMVHLDDHDWDLTQVSPLYRTTARGKARDLVATVGKDGVLRVVDRESHERIFETPITTIENVDAPITKAGTHACPGVFGGVQWNGPAYHPATNLLIVPAVDWCSTFKLADEIKFEPGQNYLGGSAAMDTVQGGWLTAVDASTGKVRWKYRSTRPMVAAVTTTAGGLVLTGELTGDFVAFDAATGAERFRHFTGGQVGGGVVTYEVKGKQYVAVASGTTSRFWADRFPGSPTITVFALDGGR